MHVSVTAIGKDRPGIIAAVTKVLLDHGANIEDSRMAILGGYFSMMLVVSADADATVLERDLDAATSALGLTVAVRSVADVSAGQSAGEPYVLGVYGADHPGIVYRVAQALADHRVNVEDLSTRVVDGDPPVYVMLLEMRLPPNLDAGELDAALKTLATELGVDVSLRPADADTL